MSFAGTQRIEPKGATPRGNPTPTKRVALYTQDRGSSHCASGRCIYNVSHLLANEWESLFSSKEPRVRLSNQLKLKNQKTHIKLYISIFPHPFKLFPFIIFNFPKSWTYMFVGGGDGTLHLSSRLALEGVVTSICSFGGRGRES